MIDWIRFGSWRHRVSFNRRGERITIDPYLASLFLLLCSIEMLQERERKWAEKEKELADKAKEWAEQEKEWAKNERHSADWDANDDDVGRQQRRDSNRS